MIAGVYDITIEQGATFSLTVKITDKDGVARNLTGYAGRGSLKAKATDTTSIEDFTVVIDDPSSGEVSITMSDVDTDAIPTSGAYYKDKTTYFYDIELYSVDDVMRILNGKAFVSPSITR